MAPKLSLMFRGCDYLSYYDTCEALAFELSDWCFHNPNQMPQPGKNDLPFHGAPERIFDLATRNAVPGLNALMIFIDGPQGHQFFMHDRTSREIAEAQNTFHVVPAGTFQPDSYASGNHPRDFSLQRCILRELAEELLGKKEVETYSRNGEDFLIDGKCQPFVNGMKDGYVKLFFLGLGFDPVTTKPEMLLAIVMDAKKL